MPRTEELASRREFLWGAAGLAGGVVAKSIFDKYKPVFAPEPQSDQVLYAGVERYPLLVSAGVNLRTEPYIPPRTRFYSRSNTVPWENITSINYAPTEGREAVVLLDTIIVYGQTVARDENRWGVVRVSQKDQEGTTDLYFSTSRSDHVQTLIDYSHLGHEMPQRMMLPTNKGTAAREIFPSIWANDIRAKFSGDLPLDQQAWPYPEALYNSVNVISAGDTTEERDKNPNTFVNVRDFPNTEYDNREPVNKLGTLAVGTNIRNVLLTRQGNWGAFRFSDLQGELINAEGRVMRLNPNTICAVHSNYLFSNDGITSSKVT